MKIRLECVRDTGGEETEKEWGWGGGEGDLRAIAIPMDTDDAVE